MSPPYHLFIDTNSLPPNPAKAGAAFHRLLELGEKEIIQVHISQVVVDEWRTQVEANLTDQLKSVYKSTKDLNRWELATSAGIPENAYKSLEEEAKAELEKVSDTIAVYINAFLEQMKANILPIPDDSLADIWARYTRGEGAFKSVKERDGFPDAIIESTFEKFIASFGAEIHVISNDSRLTQALQAVKANPQYNFLKDFIEHVAKVSPDSVNWLKFARSIMSDITQYIEDFPDALSKLVDMNQFGSPYQFGEQGGAEVTFLDDVGDVNVIETEDLGAGWVLVRYQCDVDAEISFWLSNWEFWNADDDVVFDESFDPDQPGLSAHANRQVSISGELSLRFSVEDLEQDPHAGPLEIIYDAENLLFETSSDFV